MNKLKKIKEIPKEFGDKEIEYAFNNFPRIKSKTDKEIEVANEIAKDDLLKRSKEKDKWLAKEKELSEKIEEEHSKRCNDEDYYGGRLDQLRECKSWRDEELEEIKKELIKELDCDGCEEINRVFERHKK